MAFHGASMHLKTFASLFLFLTLLSTTASFQFKVADTQRTGSTKEPPTTTARQPRRANSRTARKFFYGGPPVAASKASDPALPLREAVGVKGKEARQEALRKDGIKNLQEIRRRAVERREGLQNDVEKGELVDAVIRLWKGAIGAPKVEAAKEESATTITQKNADVDDEEEEDLNLGRAAALDRQAQQGLAGMEQPEGVYPNGMFAMGQATAQKPSLGRKGLLGNTPEGGNLPSSACRPGAKRWWWQGTASWDCEQEGQDTSQDGSQKEGAKLDDDEKLKEELETLKEEFLQGVRRLIDRRVPGKDREESGDGEEVSEGEDEVVALGGGLADLVVAQEVEMAKAAMQRPGRLHRKDMRSK